MPWWRFRRRWLRRRIRRKKEGEGRKSLQEGGYGARIIPEVAYGQRRRPRIALKKMIDCVSPKKALRAERGRRAPDAHQVIVQLLTVA